MAHILLDQMLSKDNFSYNDSMSDGFIKRTWTCLHSGNTFSFKANDKQGINDLQAFVNTCYKDKKEGGTAVREYVSGAGLLSQAPDDLWMVLRGTFRYGITKPPKQKIVQSKKGFVNTMETVTGKLVYLKDSVTGLAPYIKIMDKDKLEPYIPVKDAFGKLNVEPDYAYIIRNAAKYEKSNPTLLAKAKAKMGSDSVAMIESGKYTYAFDSNGGQIGLRQAGNETLDNVSYSVTGLAKSYRDAHASSFEGGDIEDFHGGDVNFVGMGSVNERISPTRISPTRISNAAGTPVVKKGLFSYFENNTDEKEFTDNTEMYFNMDSNVGVQGSFESNADIDLSFDANHEESSNAIGDWFKNILKRNKNKGVEVNESTAKAMADPAKVEYTPNEVQAIYEKSGTKKPLKDWLKSDDSKMFLNALAQVGYSLLLNKSQGGTAPDRTPAPDATYQGGYDPSLGYPKPEEDKKILGMHPVTFSIVAVASLALVGLGTWLVLRKK